MVESTHSADHPLHGKVYKMRNVFDSGQGPHDKWVSFRNDDRAWRAVYSEEDAVPLKFFKVDGKPNVYKLKQLWANNVYWVSHSNDGTWLYGRYDEEKDAMPIYFEKLDNNGSFSSPGE